MRLSSQGLQEAVASGIDSAHEQTVGMIADVGQRLVSVADDQAAHLGGVTDHVFSRLPAAELSIAARRRRPWRTALLVLGAVGVGFIIARRLLGRSSSPQATPVAFAVVPRVGL